MIVGGMPAVVQDYVRFPDLAACSPMQENILRLYRSDIARYAKSTEKTKSGQFLTAYQHSSTARSAGLSCPD
uniref:Uncharacterized protein n=1 Tax=Faecalibaculum rodentium TaxID=1702221 RepID=A0A140DRX1_9FIRM|nr:hypothetical protein AALO17_02640 [Faecalibaculum rodentium]